MDALQLNRAVLAGYDCSRVIVDENRLFAKGSDRMEAFAPMKMRNRFGLLFMLLPKSDLRVGAVRILA
ncbi:hypothetical protein NIES25_12590 [Nostoc linckia NIES-25]|nr:hypothetical protein NIES25_12590 [Nostoc linckia NIES-25]